MWKCEEMALNVAMFVAVITGTIFFLPLFMYLAYNVFLMGAMFMFWITGQM